MRVPSCLGGTGRGGKTRSSPGPDPDVDRSVSGRRMGSSALTEHRGLVGRQGGLEGVGRDFCGCRVVMGEPIIHDAGCGSPCPIPRPMMTQNQTCRRGPEATVMLDGGRPKSGAVVGGRWG